MKKHSAVLLSFVVVKLMFVSCSSNEGAKEYRVHTDEILTVFMPNGNWVVVDCRENDSSVSINQSVGYETDFSRSLYLRKGGESTDTVISEERLHYRKVDGMPYTKIIKDYETEEVRIWDVDTDLSLKKKFNLEGRP